MTKQINLNHNKIKNLEDDVQRMRKNKESLEKQMKTETDKHTKFKQKFEKDLISAKRAMTDKEREVIKLKQDLKKTDHQMNSKVIEQLKNKEQHLTSICSLFVVSSSSCASRDDRDRLP